MQTVFGTAADIVGRSFADAIEPAAVVEHLGGDGAHRGPGLIEETVAGRVCATVDPEEPAVPPNCDGPVVRDAASHNRPRLRAVRSSKHQLTHQTRAARQPCLREGAAIADETIAGKGVQCRIVDLSTDEPMVREKIARP
jgi:hypothetical protein